MTLGFVKAKLDEVYKIIGLGCEWGKQVNLKLSLLSLNFFVVDSVGRTLLEYVCEQWESWSSSRVEIEKKLLIFRPHQTFVYYLIFAIGEMEMKKKRFTSSSVRMKWLASTATIDWHTNDEESTVSDVANHLQWRVASQVESTHPSALEIK